MSKKKKSKRKHTTKKQKTPSPFNGKTVTGRIDVSRTGGLSFVIADGWDQDILIRAEDRAHALNGDTVAVKIKGVSSNGRTEGVVTEVLKRNQTEFSGTVEVSSKFAFLLPDNERMKVDIFIPLQLLNGAQNGDKAIARIIDWKQSAKSPTGEIIEVLTEARENDIAMKNILMEAGFPLHFQEETLEEAARIPDIPDSDEIKRRKDCRKLLTLTIDPQDAKDFDDALSFRKLKNGNFEVGVHIADVSYYVHPGTHLDREAYERATSVYLPDRVLPMLPEHISNVLCSLRPEEDKFAFSVIFQLTASGIIKQYWIGRTVIRSQRRFTYEEAQLIIETGKGDHAEEITHLHQIAQALRAKRFDNGAINFSSQEIRFRLDENSKPVGIEIKENKSANQLIEEFMLLANKTVARFVNKKNINKQAIPFPYRVHDVPDENKLAVFAAFASRFGHKFNLNAPEKIAASFNQMLNEVQGKPEQHVLEQLGIRTMAKALYTTQNIGHYGLGFEDYCHFTSPIRRYPDIMAHRIIQQCIDESVTIDKGMEAKCRHCSEQERKAMEAERAANKYKQIEFMEQYVGDIFDAVVSGVSPMGFWAETIEHKCEGMVSISNLALVDEFIFIESDYALKGLHTGIRFRIGDKVKIQVVSANLAKRQMDFEYISEKEQKGQEKPSKKEKKPALKKKKKSKE